MYAKTTIYSNQFPHFFNADSLSILGNKFCYWSVVLFLVFNRSPTPTLPSTPPIDCINHLENNKLLAGSSLRPPPPSSSSSSSYWSHYSFSSPLLPFLSLPFLSSFVFPFCSHHLSPKIFLIFPLIFLLFYFLSPVHLFIDFHKITKESLHFICQFLFTFWKLYILPHNLCYIVICHNNCSDENYEYKKQIHTSWTPSK